MINDRSFRGHMSDIRHPSLWDPLVFGILSALRDLSRPSSSRRLCFFRPQFEEGLWDVTLPDPVPRSTRPTDAATARRPLGRDHWAFTRSPGKVFSALARRRSARSPKCGLGRPRSPVPGWRRVRRVPGGSGQVGKICGI